ncbi:MAG: 1-(5-phosphoribosyl)-5-[Clostridia bacterium]|nr:1-(5-phosphoribosyl)-5-[(5-phosphoribosylamino)methylideneamino]imidazole-4-carboxamide isomerase [Clostridia bacterium]
MIIFPAIDLYEGKAVRLLKGDYAQMTVYSEHPAEVGRQFVDQGATHVHLVDLEGAREGTAPNLKTVLQLKEETGLFCEIGGGIREMDTVRTYLDNGLDRVILGTAAVQDPDFLAEALDQYGERIAVGVDIRDGYVSIRGWTENSAYPFLEFCEKMARLGVKTLICTDISRDGAMRGTNRELYRQLSQELSLQITASGGVSTLEDVRALRRMNLYGAIIGKAWYTGAIDLRAAMKEAE